MWIYIAGTLVCLFLVGIALAIAVWKSLNRYQNYPAPYSRFPRDTPVVLPCGGTNPNWGKWPSDISKIEYEDDDESFPAQVSRLEKWKVLKRECKEFEPEAVRLKELLDRDRSPSMKD